MINKHGIYFWVIPSRLSIPTLLEQHPPAFKKKVKIDVFYYIIDLITARTYKSTSEEFEGFVNINSAYFRNFHHDYKEYIEYLKIHGIIDTDYYIPEEKSYGYCINLGKIDFECPFQEIPIKDNVIRAKIESDQFYKELFSPGATSYSYLGKWFNPLLKIDANRARKILKKLYAEVEANKEHYKPKELIKAKNKLLKNLGVVEELEAQHFYCDVDNNIGRFHSNLTNLKKELRSCITYEGQKLVNIDVRNSQPFLSTCLLRAEFWTYGHHELNIYKMPSAMNIIAGYKIPKQDIKIHGIQAYEHVDELMDSIKQYTMCVTFLLKSLNKDRMEYISFAKSSLFYKKVFRKIYPGKPFDKGKVKSSFFQYIYSSNEQDYWEEKKLISKAFPSVTRLFKFLKQEDYVLLSHIMQRLESILIIEVVARRIAAEKPNLPFFTVHDSIATIPEEVDYVRRVIKEEFYKYLGIVPKLGEEQWF
jgi:hypothetical protein